MSWQMCQNESCARFREQTKLKGGCDCGEPLVPYVGADRLTKRQMAEMLSMMATQDPDKPNVSVEDAEDVLRRRPELEEVFVRKLGQAEAELAEARATA